MNKENKNKKRGEKEHELTKWILIIVAISIAIYLVSPKYYFNENLTFRCNKITGKCELRTPFSSWIKVDWKKTK